jgi:hypothetical protein
MADELRYHMAALARAAIGQDCFIELASAAGPDGRSVRICTWPGSDLTIAILPDRPLLIDTTSFRFGEGSQDAHGVTARELGGGAAESESLGSDRKRSSYCEPVAGHNWTLTDLG